MLARRNFNIHKEQAFAALVIQRNLRSWLGATVEDIAAAGAEGATGAASASTAAGVATHPGLPSVPPTIAEDTAMD